MPEWDPDNLREHYRRHQKDFPGLAMDEYEASSKRTIARGRRFTYLESRRLIPRIGYYDPVDGLFTVVDRNDVAIITHYPASEAYVRRQRESTYR